MRGVETPESLGEYPAHMKHPASLLFALLCVLCDQSSAAETRDLLLIAGQSNAVGYDAKPAELPADDADKQVMFWFRAGDPPPESPQRA